MSLITFLTRVHFADRVLEDALPEALNRLGATRPMLIMDAAGQIGDTGSRLEDALPLNAVVTTFPQLGSSVPIGRLRAASEVFVKGECDSLICLGGKTALDFGRVLAAFLPGPASRPLIAVPTTVANVGLGPVHMPGLMASSGKLRQTALPAAILLDATLTLAVEPHTLAANGFNALTNCIEAFLATAYNPPADGIALEGIRRSSLFLERAVSEHGDLDAHRELLAVALNAGLAAQKGFGGVEALARAAEDEIEGGGAHGRLYPSVMRPVMAFNAPAVGGSYQRIAEAMALPGQSDVADALVTMGQRIGLPERLGTEPIDGQRLDSVARRAAADPANLTNPRHATQADYRALLEQAL
jgi:4-hydroxybutyrate dehydrogenase